MWPITPRENEVITVSFSPTCLTCSWIQKTNKSYAPFLLRAYERTQLQCLELENLILFNPTKIKNIITNFLHKHKQTNAIITFSLHGPALHEQFIALPTSTPTSNSFGNNSNNRNIQWDYQYMYPHDNGTFVFYTYSIARSIILQYQLLSIAAHLNLTTITTQRMALLNMYRYLFGSAFRQSQLGVDMQRHHNMIEELLSPEMIKRLVTIPVTIDTIVELPYLSTACGLFIQEKELS